MRRIRRQKVNTSKMYGELYNIVEHQSPLRFFESYLGFEFENLTSLSKFTKLMFQPKDPSSLGIVRIFFGELKTKYLFIYYLKSNIIILNCETLEK